MIIKCKDAETYVMYNTIVFMIIILVWLFLIAPVIMIITSMSANIVMAIGHSIAVGFALWRTVFDKSMKDDFTTYMIGSILFGVAVPMKYVVDKFIKYELVKGNKDGN